MVKAQNANADLVKFKVANITLINGVPAAYIRCKAPDQKQ
jgi:hypothetical protein